MAPDAQTSARVFVYYVLELTGLDQAWETQHLEIQINSCFPLNI